MTPAERWVDEMARLTRPARVVWCDGSEAENAALVAQMVGDGTLQRLHPERAPGCTLHRSHPSDVARTEHLTFIASRAQQDAGPTNNWMSPQDARAKVGPLFEGVMAGRTLAVAAPAWCTTAEHLGNTCACGVRLTNRRSGVAGRSTLA